MKTDFPRERPETLAMVWPQTAPPPTSPQLPEGFTLRVGADRAAFASAQATIGFALPHSAWRDLTARLVPDAMVFAAQSATGEPVAVAAAERRDGGWVELGWVAVAPAHRGMGLGLAVCAALTGHLLARGHTRLFGSTQDHRLAALRLYFTLGFRPVLRAENADRWQAVCDRLGATATR